ncbi:thioester reductase domain-containing protein [Providencia sp. 21OH12SH02B-Prov]|uniref:non-ribosomal peptide synthetase n=1 Tax=Providencia sp. 21OH12SH02B-Prov TaxID=3015951 RepID=UPI0022B6696B|nr:non-ribosomal peptide synthetase [Providencia sp. 21OH12SH02B-Prov]WBA56322.1 thioester reductase domain-containing protein [Providencia sp. 21OH12SH02B-Prov]
MLNKEKKQDNIQEIFIPSQMQKALINSAITGSNLELYVEQSHLRVTGNFKIDLFEESWRLLIERHDCLRSAFLWEQLKDIHQVILNKFSFKVNVKDIKGYSHSEKMDIINDYIEYDAKKGFDFKVPPLMRITVFILGENTFDIILTIHHAIIDGWSIQILTKEFTKIYQALSNGSFLELSEPVSFKKYINWYRKLDFNQANLFWDKKIAMLEQVSKFPLSMKPQTITNHEKIFGKKVLYIEEEVTEGILAFCARCGITENSFVSATWSILLSLLCSIDKVVFGSVVSQRPIDLVRGNEIVGPLINSIPIIIGVDDRQNITDFLKYVQNELMESYSYSYLPINEILEKVGRIESNNKIDQKLFDTIVSVEKHFKDTTQNKGNLLGLDFKFIDQPTRVDFPIVFKCNLYKLELVYFSHYLADDYADNIVSIFLKLMRAIILSPNLTIRELLQDLSNSYPKLKGENLPHQLSLNQEIHLNAKLNPYKNAISDKFNTYTYLALSEKIKSIAYKLAIKKGEVIGVYQERGIDSFLSMLAIFECGGCYLPLDISYPPERLRYIVKDSKIGRIITTNSTDRIFENIEYIFINDLKLVDSSIENREIVLDLDNSDVAYIIYTSGSTGTPKGAINTYHGMRSLVTSCKNMMNNQMKFAQTMQFSSINFDASILELVLSVVSCSCLNIIPEEKRQDLSQLVKYINDKRIQFAFLPPIIITHLDKNELNELDMLLTGGDVCPVNFASDWITEPSKSFYNLYGPTEASIMATYNPIHETKNSLSLGYPLPNTEIKIIDNEGNLLPAGVVGEILIIGEGVGLGYLHNQDLTSRNFKYGGYCTGDLAYYDCDNMLYFMGRNDEQVQIRGFRVELGEIENIIRKSFNFQDAVIISENVLNNTKLYLFLLSSEGKNIDLKEIKHVLRPILPSYMIPSELHLIENWPVTINKKIDRAKLKEMYCTSRVKRQTLCDGKKTEFEEAVINEIAETLRINTDIISSFDDFFEIGGNSLTLTTLILRLNKKFKMDLPFQLVYDNSRIGELAKRIEELNNSDIKNNQQNITSDCILDDSIATNHLLPMENVSSPKKILLTGSTGFVGVYFIKELIENTSADIYCLVRGDDVNNATRRVHDNLINYNLFSQNDLKRILIVLGDFSISNFGIEDKLYNKLSKEIDSIIHCGANVNLANTYSRMSGANVNGSLNIIKFATHIKLKPIHHISTVSVLAGIIGKVDIIHESKMLSEDMLPENGYIRSKWASEKMMDNARKKGVPINIYRLPRVWGDSSTGQLNPNDSLLMLLSASIEIKKFPLLPDAFLSYIIPVDYCVTAINMISKEIKGVGKNYHVLYPQNISLNKIVNKIRDKGIELNAVLMEEWLDTLKKYASEINSSMVIKSAASFSLGFIHDILNSKFTQLDNGNVINDIKLEEIEISNDVFDKYIEFLIYFSKRNRSYN